MTTAINRLGDGTIELTLTVPWSRVSESYERVVEAHVATAELPGFRKGKAPRKLVEEKLDKSKTYEEVLRELIPAVYNEAITQEKIRPIIQPKIELKKAEEGSDWEIKIVTCEKPTVTLGDYKKGIKDLTINKRNKIWVPGKDNKGADKDEDKTAQNKPTIDELVEVIINNVTLTLADVIIEQEINRMLSQLVDQTKKLGLTIDQYLASTGRTAESIRQEYKNQARRNLKFEFALEAIADSEAVTISDEDINAFLKTAKTEAERASMEKERYYLASILRRQKTLDILAAL